MGRIGRTLHLPRTWGGKVLAVLVVLALAAGIGVGTALGAPVVFARLSAAGSTVVPTAAPPAPITAELSLRGVGNEAPVPTPAGMVAALSRPAGSPALGSLSGQVLDPATGQSLWARDANRPLVPGSTAKLVTAAAALLALEPDARLETKVVAAAAAGTVVLVGGGDPTLSALPAGKESVYPGAARLDDLVEQVRKAVPGGIGRVLVDVDRYAGSGLGPGWLPVDVPAGFVAPIVPVMLDGGRAVPTDQNGTRTSTPALAAAAELARRLGADPAGVAVGAASPSAPVLGVVRSPPVRELVGTVLRTSDNVLAEVLAREVAIWAGAEPSFAGAAAAGRQVLTDNGIDTAGLNIVDGSGLSGQNRVTAAGLAGLLAAAATPGASDPRTARLRALAGGLPVAGGNGTLADRYLTGPATAGRGYVRAKTGTLDGANSLAGLVVDTDGRLLVFALLSNGSAANAARPALDAIAATLRSCGCR